LTSPRGKKSAKKPPWRTFHHTVTAGSDKPTAVRALIKPRVFDV
jgi:hypothetical protein